MTELKQRLARLLLDKSYLAGEITLTSGKKSSFYFDCKQTALHPEGGYLIGRLLLEKIQPGVHGVGGLTLGADPLVSAVSVVSFLENRPLPGFIVRKEPKGHGTKSYLEGLANFRDGDKVAVLEDVVTTGKSLLQACERVRLAGLDVFQVLCLLDRGEGGRESLQEQGYNLEALYTREDLLGSG